MPERVHPASVGQILLWMIRHYRPDFGALNCPLLCCLRGPLDETALEAALTELTRRHAALRTTFTGRGPALRQVVHDPRPVPVTRTTVDESTVDKLIAEELASPIDIADWPTRVTLWRTGPEDHVLCLNTHHLVTDAWSCGVLFRELRELYGGARLDEPTSWQYPRFAEHQRTLLAGPDMRRHKDFWRRALTGATLPHFPARAPRDSESPGAVREDLDAATANALRALAKRERTTPFAVLLSVFLAQLRRTTGQTDLTVASLFANRSRPEVRDTVGFLANMVLLRAAQPANTTFAELVRRTHDSVIGAFTHQELPYQMLPLHTVETGGARADDVVFQLMADPEYRTTVRGCEFELLVPEGIGSRFRVELAIAPLGDTYRAVLFHTPDRLDTAAASRLLNGYVALAGAVAAAPDVPLTEI
jgi:hypothetical protein